MATFDIGPGNSRLILRTGREGVAQKVGHDLTITFDTWSGSVEVPDDVTQAKVRVTVQLGSLKITDGTGGVTALTDDDRRDITGTALRLLEADAHPEATFDSTSVAGDADHGSLQGTLTIRGVSVPVTFDVTSSGPGAWTASATVNQSSFGIKPYRAFFGALRLADTVRIQVDVAH